MVDDATGNHQSWEKGASGNPTERVPGSIIEPIPELVVSIGDKVLGCSKVEPRVDYRGQG